HLYRAAVMNKVRPKTKGLYGIAAKQADNLSLRVENRVDQEDFLLEEPYAVLQVEAHGGIVCRRPNVVEACRREALKVVPANRLLTGATWQNHLQAAAETEQQMRFNQAEQHNQIKLRQEPVDQDGSASGRRAQVNQLQRVK